MMDYMPLQLNPLEREKKVKPWLDEITKDLDADYLSPEGWSWLWHLRLDCRACGSRSSSRTIGESPIKKT
jgi:5-methylcytosine-specific restriction endonuclease McrA